MIFLKKYGLVKNKSLILEYPNSIPDEFQPDFIRGFFDGDGSIVYHKTKWNTYPQVSIVTGSRRFAEGFTIALQNYGIESHIYTSNRRSNNNYYIRITKINEVKKFKKLIYQNDTNFKLKRKYEKFAQLDYINKIYSNVAN